MDEDRVYFDNMAHTDFLSYMLNEPTAKEQFKLETGYDLNTLVNRNPLEKMIDEATGYGEEIMARFIVWATDTHWNTPEESRHIEAYKRTKERIKS